MSAEGRAVAITPSSGREYPSSGWVTGSSAATERDRQRASYQIRKLAGCACAGNAGNPFPATAGLRSRHASRVTHVPWCMPRSLTGGFLWSRWRGKFSRHSRHMRNPQFYVSDKRPMVRFTPTLGLYSLSGWKFYRKILWSLEATRFGFRLLQSLWNLTGNSAAVLPKCLSNFRAIRPL